MRVVPGFPNMAQGAGGLTVVYRTSQQNVDVWADVGSPTVPVFVQVVVDAGVEITSGSYITPAMSLEGFAAGSSGSLVNIPTAIIEGAGGQGAQGGSFIEREGGCGGGGAGNIPGPGGFRDIPETQGSPGTSGIAGVGGAGGLGEDDVTGNLDDGDNAQPGGAAITIGGVDLVVVNAGAYILGGGGGGGGGDARGGGQSDGSDGGDHGEIGGPRNSSGGPNNKGGEPGVGGYAIQYTSGGSVTFISGGSDPNVKGNVGL